MAKERLLNIGLTEAEIQVDPSISDKFIGRLQITKELPLLRRLWTTKINSRQDKDKFQFITQELGYALMTAEEHEQGMKRRKFREARIACATYAAQLVDCL